MIGNKVTLSFGLGLIGLRKVVLWLSPSAYMNQPAAPIKMSAGRNIISIALLRFLLTFLGINFAPVYHSGV
jgi:hypothetical protein